MIQREWSSKEPISFPLWRQKERGDVSERKNYGKRTINEIMLAGSNAGKGVEPWECVPRHTRAGGRSRGLRSKAWTGRGPGRRRFLRPCKNLRQPRTSHGRHPSRRTACRRRRVPKHCMIRPTSRISLDYHGNGPAGKTFIFPSANSSRLMKTIRSEPVADVLPWYTQ